MGQGELCVVRTVLLAAAVAACGGGSPSTVPSSVANAAPSASLDPTPPTVPGATATPVPDGRATATITVEQGVEADGPGASVRDAIANAAIGPQLVNGILLREVDGTVWLCEVLLTSSPAQCAEPRLRVENRPEDEAFVQGGGLHEADGIRWVERVQICGTVRP
jgi:hypothetical protein